jgi:hypothetical protein
MHHLSIGLPPADTSRYHWGPAQIPACGFCFAAPSVSRTRLLPKVRRKRHSGLGRPIQFQSVGVSRRGHAGSSSVSGTCIGLRPLLRPAAFPPRSPLPPIGQCCSRLYRYYPAVRLVRFSGSASAPRLPELIWNRRGGCGRLEVSQVPTRSLTARTGLRLRWSGGPSQNGPAHVACGGL